ncbi:hypothetical protein KKG45_08285 [bacterium]|nr:hypothetical protein [bacterium]MBU1073231.1 hypothetical protein [bacterium]MBU1676818.1 hypothetical protein [bacterium]
MPGIFGVVALRPDRDASGIAGAMRGLITHQEWYRSCVSRRGGRVLGAVSVNPAFREETHLAADGDVRLLVEGTALTIDGRHVPDTAPDFARRLLEIYLADGDDFIHRVGGHFNLVIDDGRDGRLIILNDHLGFSQMHWYLDDQVFLFGPELKVCLAWRGVDLEVDRASVATFLAQECPFGDHTLLRRAKILMGGSRLVLRDGRASLERYWRPNFEAVEERSREDFGDEALSLYERSMAKRLPADAKRIVVALSGGLDSRLLLHLVRERGDDLQIFTHGQPDCDEYLIARQVVRTLGLEHRHELIEIRPAWYGEHARQAVWLNDGMCNARNAGLIGISAQLGPGPDPFLNGIIGPYLAIGSGHYIKPEDLVLIEDEEELRRNVLAFTGADRGSRTFDLFMAPDTAQEMRELARDQIWSTFQDFRRYPQFGIQKMMHLVQNTGRRMQTSVDVHKYFFHDLTPFVDTDLFDLYQRIPLPDKLQNPIYLDMYRRRVTDLARVPWSRTGHDLFADPRDVARTVDRRMKRLELNKLVRKLTRGRINPRSRVTYHDREAWLRKNKVYRDEITGVLSDVAASGCDFILQAKVDRLLSEFDKGKDWYFHNLMQIYTSLVWHEQFLRSAPRGCELRPLGE